MRRIVVHLKSCPTRLLGPYGCEWAETPTLDRLAAEGVVFDGHYAKRVGIEVSSLHYAETLNGFDTSALPDALNRLSQSDHGSLLIESDPFALPWDEWEDGDLNLDDEETREAFFAEATARVTAFDDSLDSLLKSIQKHCFDESIVLVVTATSGLPVGEHGVLGTTSSRLHEELVHLPLLIRFPNARLAGYRVAGFTTHDDLVELLATGSTDRLDALILGTAPTRETVITTRGDPPIEISLRTADSCLILPLGDNPHLPLLFDRPDDRFEVNDLSTRQPDRVEELKDKLNADFADFR